MPPHRKVPPRSPELGALGKAVEQLRTEAGLNLEQLAEKVGSDQTQVGGIERGVRNPSYEFLLRLAAALGKRVGEITTLADHLYDTDQLSRTTSNSPSGR